MPQPMEIGMNEGTRSPNCLLAVTRVLPGGEILASRDGPRELLRPRVRPAPVRAGWAAHRQHRHRTESGQTAPGSRAARDAGLDGDALPEPPVIATPRHRRRSITPLASWPSTNGDSTTKLDEAAAAPVLGVGAAHTDGSCLGSCTSWRGRCSGFGPLGDLDLAGSFQDRDAHGVTFTCLYGSLRGTGGFDNGRRARAASPGRRHTPS